MTVVAALFCGDPGAPILHSSGAVTLEPNGYFEVEGTIDNLPLPEVCANPVLLIRANGAGGPWIAAGIRIPEDD